jgi:hypothetical protein
MRSGSLRIKRADIADKLEPNHRFGLSNSTTADVQACARQRLELLDRLADHTRPG